MLIKGICNSGCCTEPLPPSRSPWSALQYYRSLQYYQSCSLAHLKYISRDKGLKKQPKANAMGWLEVIRVVGVCGFSGGAAGRAGAAGSRWPRSPGSAASLAYSAHLRSLFLIKSWNSRHFVEKTQRKHRIKSSYRIPGLCGILMNSWSTS